MPSTPDQATSPLFPTGTTNPTDQGWQYGDGGQAGVYQLNGSGYAPMGFGGSYYYGTGEPGEAPYTPANSSEPGFAFGSSNIGPPDIQVNGVDYSQLFQQQEAANRNNTTSPFGSSQQVFNPQTGQWTTNNTLSGPGQAEFNEAQSLSGMLGNMSTGLDTSQLTPWGTVPTYSGATAQQGANDAYAYAKGNLDPQWNQQQTQLQGQLAAEGLHPGDPAYQQQMNSFNTSKDTAYQQANLGAFQTGATEASTQTGAEATAANTANAQRLQQVQEQLTQAGWTTNEINSLLGGAGVSGAPGSPQAPAAPNNAAAIGQAQASQQQLQSQLLNNAIGGGAGALSAVAGVAGAGGGAMDASALAAFAAL